MLRNVPGSVGAFGETATAAEEMTKVMTVVTARAAGTRIDRLGANLISWRIDFSPIQL
jgi:hypothetical protein